MGSSVMGSQPQSGAGSVSVLSSDVIRPHDRHVNKLLKEASAVMTLLRHYLMLRTFGHNRSDWSPRQFRISALRGNHLVSRGYNPPGVIISRLLTDGTISPEPEKTTRYGMMKVCATVTLGLYLGAAIRLVNILK